MKRAFVIILLSVCAWMIVGAIDNSSADSRNLLAASSWKFKNVYCQNLSTAQYLTPLYTGTTYTFEPNGSYTGKFFELSNAGTWEISTEILVLNKGTHKEEAFTISMPSPDKLILEITEKGDKALLEFTKL